MIIHLYNGFPGKVQMHFTVKLKGVSEARHQPVNDLTQPPTGETGQTTTPGSTSPTLFEEW